MTASHSSTSHVRQALGILGAVILGTVFLVAAWAKMLDPASFAKTIQSEGLEILLPALVIAVLVLALEVGIGAALILGLRRPAVLVPTTALVIFFVFLTGRAYWRFLNGTLPDDAGCGCFGNLVERTPAQAFWQDLLLMVPPLILAWIGRVRTAAIPWRRYGVVAALCLATMVFTWKAPSLPLDDWATRLRAGVETTAICAGSEDDGTRVCLSTIVPELLEGQHLVVITDLDEPDFLEQVPALNEHLWAGATPPVWVLSAAEEEALFQFRFQAAPAFDVREAPPAMLKSLYRTLPRAFQVTDGQVTDTWAGMPPLPPSGDAETIN